MRVMLALLASTSVLIATPALANCTNIVDGKVASGYIYKDFGTTASTDPVGQGSYTAVCDKLSYNVLVIAGPQGGTADEVDGAIYYDTTSGPVKLQLSGQFYAVNLHNSLLKSADDIAEFYADASVPSTHGRFTIAPLVRVVQVVGFKTIPSQTMLQPGIRFDFQATKQVTFSADVRDSINLTKRYSTIRVATIASYQATSRTSIRLGWETTDRTPSVVSLGFVHTF